MKPQTDSNNYNPFKWSFRLLIVLLFMGNFIPRVSAQTTYDGDTIFVQTIVPTNKDSTKYGTFLFPPLDTSFEKILMYATFECTNCASGTPGTGGDDWNYGFFAGPDSIDAYEIARFETPFSNSPFSFRNGFTWVYDVTDYRPVLQGSVYIQAGNNGESWRGGIMSLKFVMIKGTPPRNPINVHQVYRGFWDYSYPLIGDSMSPKTFTTTTSEQGAKFILRIVGNGYGDNLNCAEFCPRWDSIYVNGTRRFTTYMYRTNCDMDPLVDVTGTNVQEGTWWYDRGEWCPGSNVENFEYEVTPYYTPGSPLTVQAAIQYYQWTHDDSTPASVANPPKYSISSQLITFGAANFSLDAAVAGIIAPNNIGYYSRFNPICGNPVIVIENTGSTTLTSLTISYGIQGVPPQTYSWTGSLAFLQKDTVTLPSLNSWTAWNGSKVFTATVSSPNGGTDQYAQNNSYNSYVTFPTNYTDNKLVFELETNDYGSYYSDTLKNSDGTVIFSRGSLASSTLYKDTVTLNPGCYTYALYAQNLPEASFGPGEFGLSCPFYSIGSPYDKIVDISNGTKNVTFNNWFGAQIYYPFTVNDALGVQNINNDEDLVNVYPNPVKDIVNVNVALPTSQDVTIAVYTILGTKVFQQTYKQIASSTIPINLSGNSNGVYIVNIITQNESISRKIILQK